MVLPCFKVLVCAVIQLFATIGTAHNARKHICLSCPRRASFIFPQFLHPRPCVSVNDCLVGILKHKPFFLCIVTGFLTLVGLLIGLKIYRMPLIFWTLQNVSYGIARPVIGMVVQDQVWNRVTINRAAHKSTRYYIDEMHLLLKEDQTAAYTIEIWKRFRKWGGIPTGITQNIKDLLASREIENIFENSDFVYMLNQASGDRQILARQLGISPHQLSYVTHSGEGEGLLFYGNIILPFIDRFPKDTELYRIMTTKLQELKEGKQS